MKRRIDAKAEEIEEAHGRKLTNRQKMFARHFVDGTHSNAECARLAGYSDKNGIAKIQAHKLLNASDFPMSPNTFRSFEKTEKESMASH